MAFAALKSEAIGLPTILLRPTTTARLPLKSPTLSRKSVRHPSGVQAIKPAERGCSGELVVPMRPKLTG